MMTAMKWFYGFLKKYRLRMLFGMVLVTILAAAALASPYISKIIVDTVIKGGKTEYLIPLVGILVGLVVVKGICRFSSQVLFETSSQGVLYAMRDKVYRKLLMEDFAFYNKNRTGDLMGRQTGDMDAIRHFVAYVIYTIYENILYFVLALVLIFTINVPMALCMVIVLPLAALTTYLQAKSVHPAFKKCRDAFSGLNTFVQENISGNRVVKAFAKEDYEKEKFNVQNDIYREAELGAAKIWRRYVPVFEFLSYVLTIILMLVGGIMVVKGQMTLGDLVAVNGYLWMLTVPLRMAGWWINDVQRFTTSVEKIYDTYSAEPDIKRPKKPVKHKKLEGNVTFKNVSYRADDEDILQNINFDVKKGETVGIIGTTGAGKSTIVNLMCRFFDATEGEVLVDGVNVKDYDMHDLRDNIGMAMQDVFLFSDTIEGNIAYGKPDISFEKVKEVARMADANHFIQNLPEGYDTVITGDGANLSQGQRQLLAIARAAVADPPVLILDEATSSIDTRTERIIQESMDRLMHGRTTFVIAHRLSTVRNSDCIMVLEQGRIIERGTHDQLISEKGKYYQLYTGNAIAE